MSRQRTPYERKPTRLPADPLIVWLRRVVRHDTNEYDAGEWGQVAPTAADMALYCGVDHNTLRRWRSQGMTLNAIDKVCHHLGLHPIELWGEAYELAALAVAC